MRRSPIGLLDQFPYICGHRHSASPAALIVQKHNGDSRVLELVCDDADRGTHQQSDSLARESSGSTYKRLRKEALR